MDNYRSKERLTKIITEKPELLQNLNISPRKLLLFVEHLENNNVVVREKGEWEWKMGIPRCSVCNDPAPGDPYDGEVYTTTFCPNCGSDMRKGENNGKNLL